MHHFIILEGFLKGSTSPSRSLKKSLQKDPPQFLPELTVRAGRVVAGRAQRIINEVSGGFLDSL